MLFKRYALNVIYGDEYSFHINVNAVTAVVIIRL